LLVLLLLPAALALDVARQDLPWTELPLQAGAPEALPQGPEQLAAGPGGRLALYDAASREVVLIEGGRAALSFPVDRCADLAFTAAGDLLVLDTSARSLALWSPQGVALAQAHLPERAPTGLLLVVEGDQVYGRDLFGNLHPLALVDHAGLRAPEQDRLVERAGAVRWDPAAGVFHVRPSQGPDVDVPAPGAVKASGQLQGSWLVVDTVLGDTALGDTGPLRVRREVVSLPSLERVALPVEGRLYAPHGDLALGSDGSLWVLDPEAAGLGLVQVRP